MNNTSSKEKGFAQSIEVSGYDNLSPIKVSNIYSFHRSGVLEALKVFKSINQYGFDLCGSQPTRSPDDSLYNAALLCLTLACKETYHQVINTGDYSRALIAVVLRLNKHLEADAKSLLSASSTFQQSRKSKRKGPAKANQM